MAREELDAASDGQLVEAILAAIRSATDCTAELEALKAREGGRIHLGTIFAGLDEADLARAERERSVADAMMYLAEKAAVTTTGVATLSSAPVGWHNAVALRLAKNTHTAPAVLEELLRGGHSTRALTMANPSTPVAAVLAAAREEPNDVEAVAAALRNRSADEVVALLWALGPPPAGGGNVAIITAALGSGDLELATAYVEAVARSERPKLAVIVRATTMLDATSPASLVAVLRPLRGALALGRGTYKSFKESEPALLLTSWVKSVRGASGTGPSLARAVAALAPDDEALLTHFDSRLQADHDAIADRDDLDADLAARYLHALLTYGGSTTLLLCGPTVAARALGPDRVVALLCEERETRATGWEGFILAGVADQLPLDVLQRCSDIASATGSTWPLKAIWSDAVERHGEPAAAMIRAADAAAQAAAQAAFRAAVTAAEVGLSSAEIEVVEAIYTTFDGSVSELVNLARRHVAERAAAPDTTE